MSLHPAHRTSPLPAPPSTTEFSQDARVTKGGNAAGYRSALRAASRNYPPSASVTQGIGFRLVRTLK